MSTPDYNYISKSQDHNACQLPHCKSNLPKPVLFKEGFCSIENTILSVFKLHKMGKVDLKRFLEFSLV